MFAPTEAYKEKEEQLLTKAGILTKAVISRLHAYHYNIDNIKKIRTDTSTSVNLPHILAAFEAYKENFGEDLISEKYFRKCSKDHKQITSMLGGNKFRGPNKVLIKSSILNIFHLFYFFVNLAE